jgi:hypothetical protein
MNLQKPVQKAFARQNAWPGSGYLLTKKVHPYNIGLSSMETAEEERRARLERENEAHKGSDINLILSSQLAGAGRLCQVVPSRSAIFAGEFCRQGKRQGRGFWFGAATATLAGV